MIKPKYIIFLSLFLSIIFNCAPDKYILKNRHLYKNKRVNNSELISGDESFAWSYNDDFEFKDYRNSGYNDDKCDYNNSYFRKDNKKTVESKRNRKSPKIIKKKRILYKTKIYKVKKNDNLSKISKKFNITINEICSLNRIKNKNKIFAGMLLKIPAKGSTAKTITIKQKTLKNKPRFNWPVKKIIKVKSDAQDGVKPIGIIITAQKGSNILSSASGVVEKIGRMRGFGRYVILKHQKRYFTIYSNLKKIFVLEGENIRSGITIGRLDGNKLHFQIDYSGKSEDPLRYLSKKG